MKTTIRHGEHWRRQQFSWINEWEELISRTGRCEGMELVLPDWFYQGVLAGAIPGGAHAFLDHAQPKVGSVVKESPAAVTIWFSEDVKPDFSKIEVFNSKAQPVDLKESKVNPGDRSQMTVSLPKLPPGSYKVVWNATCKLGHHTTGSFTFQVAGPG